MDVSIIVVNWNVRELLGRCLASLEANCGNLSLEVIVVDNASSDGSAQMVRSEFPKVRLIASQKNVGYTGGNNLGAKEAAGRYLLILNPDAEIVGGAVGQMIAYLDSHPDVGVVGPQLVYPDGTLQPSRRRFPQAMTALFDGTPFSLRWFPNNRFERAYYMTDRPDDEIQSVDWLVGAALMIRREAWQKVGPLDEQFFMYSEELDWCHRCRDAGWEIHYLPAARIVHHEEASARQIPATTRIRIFRSRILYFRKYFGAGWANAIRLFLLMNFACVLAEETAKWVVDRRKTRRQRMSTYWQVLQSGLR